MQRYSKVSDGLLPFSSSHNSPYSEAWTLEPFIQGKYEKFSNNGNYVNHSGKGRAIRGCRSRSSADFLSHVVFVAQELSSRVRCLFLLREVEAEWTREDMRFREETTRRLEKRRGGGRHRRIESTHVCFLKLCFLVILATTQFEEHKPTDLPDVPS